jgi:hypothetical protein
VREGESKSEAAVAGHWHMGPASTVPDGTVWNEFNDIYWFKHIQKHPNFDRFKKYLPVLQKCEIKYGWKEFEIRINLPYRNFSRFGMEFELKVRELSVGRI